NEHTSERITAEAQTPRSLRLCNYCFWVYFLCMQFSSAYSLENRDKSFNLLPCEAEARERFYRLKLFLFQIPTHLFARFQKIIYLLDLFHVSAWKCRQPFDKFNCNTQLALQVAANKLA